jgi:hypothetical protein
VLHDAAKHVGENHLRRHPLGHSLRQVQTTGGALVVVQKPLERFGFTSGDAFFLDVHVPLAEVYREVFVAVPHPGAHTKP